MITSFIAVIIAATKTAINAIKGHLVAAPSKSIHGSDPHLVSNASMGPTPNTTILDLRSLGQEPLSAWP